MILTEEYKDFLRTECGVEGDEIRAMERAPEPAPEVVEFIRGLPQALPMKAKIFALKAYSRDRIDWRPALLAAFSEGKTEAVMAGAAKA